MDTPPPIPVFSPPVPPPLPSKKKGSVLKTVVLVGLGVLVLGALVVGGSVVLYRAVMERIQNSEVYVEAWKRMEASPEVVAALGSPLKQVGMFQGSMVVKNDKSQVQFRVTVTGPKGLGQLEVEATRVGKQAWQFGVLEMSLEDGKSIDLREQPRSLPAESV